MARIPNTVFWVLPTLVTLYLALLGTFYDWLSSVWPGSSVPPPRDYYVWGIVVLWFAFLGCLAGLFMERRRSTNR